MKSMNKIILAGLAAFWASCSSEKDTPEVTGATTEPNTSQMANLTKEQVAILTKSFYTFIDTVKVIENGIPINSVEEDCLDCVDIYQPVLLIDSEYVEITRLRFPFNTKADTTFYHRSNDGRKSCDVTTFSQESGAMIDFTYDARSLATFGAGMVYSGGGTARIIEVDSVPVIMRTVGGANYWGYGISCAEFLEQFKDSCSASNGIFKDFGNGCNGSQLNLACSMLIPEDMNVENVVEIFKDEFLKECKEDSIRYAPVDDIRFEQQGCFGSFGPDHSYSTCIPNEADPSLDSLSKDWQLNLTRTFDDYWHQFSDLGEYSVIPELVFGDYEMQNHFVSYNTFPSDEVASEFREEGAYRLPDSLVAVFFPKVAESPSVFEVLAKKNEVYYMIVLKDVGAKGHVLRSIDDSEILVTDIVKSGDNCPEDTEVHYSTFLVRGSIDWNVVEKTIVKHTYVSRTWNCNNPESLEQIEPYGEWVYPYGVI